MPRAKAPAKAPLIHTYEPKGSARELFLCRDPEVVMSGSAGTGKTRAVLEKILIMSLRNPGMRSAILRKTAHSLTSTTLVTWEQFVAKEALQVGDITWYGGSAREPANYRFTNGSSVVVGGLDKPDKIMSSEYDVMYISEGTECTLDDWEKCTTRLRNGKAPFHQMIADCNPNAPQHWLNQRCISGTSKMIFCRHEDNPRLWNDQRWTPEGTAYIDRLDMLTGVRLQRLRYGIWAAADGLVYPEYDPQLHLGPVMDGPPPAEWDRYLSIDFGYNNPFTCQFWAEDHDGRLHLWKEVYRTQTIVEDHAEVIKRIIASDEGAKRPRAIICDHDAEDRATLERKLEMSTVAAQKTVTDGIQAVQERMRVKGDGLPGIVIHRGALHDRDQALSEAHKPMCLEEELLEYVWEPSIARGINTGVAKEHPLKVNDHGCLVAGTQVTTFHGLKSIEDIQAGDLVLTRCGWRTVVNAGMTSRSAQVFTVRMSDGKALTGTGNHPVMTSDGWKRLDALRYHDILVVCEQMPRERKSSDSTVSSSAGTKMMHTSHLASVTGTEVSEDFTLRSGNTVITKTKSQKDARYTTRTSTHSTMTRRTSYASPSQSTKKFTVRRALNGARPQQASLTLRRQESPHPSGTGLTKEEPGTVSMQKTVSGVTRVRKQRSAGTAAPSLRRLRLTTRTVTALISAKQRSAGLAVLTTRSVLARSVDPSSLSTSTAAQNAAAVHVLSVVEQAIRQPVYNLTVSDSPEYVANGILVHNCDAMRYMVAQLDLKRGVNRVRVLRY